MQHRKVGRWRWELTIFPCSLNPRPLSQYPQPPPNPPPTPPFSIFSPVKSKLKASPNSQGCSERWRGATYVSGRSDLQLLFPLPLFFFYLSCTTSLIYSLHKSIVLEYYIHCLSLLSHREVVLSGLNGTTARLRSENIPRDQRHDLRVYRHNTEYNTNKLDIAD